ncbi:MAG: helix-turn-helix domain-containing protein [Spirochaetaceae bacterium]|jgi:transcriptional regulator with XRE-family HTH domain|nr:helix-turn-helix domain-containing protein [Spirochaetaceae bacterium]
MTSLRQLLASNLRENRKRLGLSQEKLAAKVNTAAAYVAKIETGRQFPSPEMLERLAAALEIDSPELFSKEPMQIASVRKLRKEISTDIEHILAARLCEFERNFWYKE